MIKFAQGTPDTMIARLCDAISGFDPKWVGKCRPATEKQIQKLKNIAEKYHWELPDAYLRYLGAMGRDDAGLIGNEYGRETSAAAILKLLHPKEIRIDDERCLERGFFLFSNHWADANVFLALSGKEPQVVDGVYGNSDGRYVAGSFEKYLFQQAFRKYEETFVYHKWDHRSVCDREREEKCNTCSVGGKTADERMAYVRRLTRAYGLEGAWFGDRANFFWYRERYALEINVWDGFCIGAFYNDAALEEKLEYLALALEENQKWLYQFFSSGMDCAPDGLSDKA